MPEFDYTDYGPKYKGIPDFPGYHAGTDGSIWSSRKYNGRNKPALTNGSWKKLSFKTDQNGYHEVAIYRNGKRFSKKVYSLVAITFLGQRPTDRHEVAHWDGVRSNDILGNLRWATKKENENDKIRHGTIARGERSGSAKVNSEQVADVVHRYTSGETQKAIAKSLGEKQQLVSAIVTGRCWGHLTGIVKKKKATRIAEAAAVVLRETGNPSITFGDEILCHMIADKLGWDHDGPNTTRKIIKNLRVSPGELVRTPIRGHRNRPMLKFVLPEFA